MKSITSIILLKNIWYYLSRRRKFQVLVTLLIMLFSAISELVSLTAAIPFLYLISTEPKNLANLKFFEFIYEISGIQQPEQLLLPIICAFIFFAALSGFLRTLNLYLITKLSANIGTDFSTKAYKGLINRPFDFYLNENSSNTITSLTKYIEEFVSVVSATLEIFTGFLTSFFLIGGILFVNSSLAILALFIFGMAYFLLSKYINKILKSNSLRIANLQNDQIKVIQESTGSIRNIILDNIQDYFSSIYFFLDSGIRTKMAQNQFLTYFPKSIFESVGLIFIAIITFLYSKNIFSSIDLIPVLGALAIGLQRLLPSLQKIYSSWASFKSYGEGARRIIRILDESTLNDDSLDININYKFKDKLVFEKVSFKYHSSNKYLISGLDLEICKGDRIAIIGSSGSGKSTFLDLIMGLLRPTKGKIIIDGENLYSNKLITSWRNIISHVPQEVFLADTTILENIAIGIPILEIDKKKVKKCSELANISSFVDGLPKKYETYVGERGSKLSVGQKQRIGIARALYKSAEILILDEATSALDKKTEEKVLSTIKQIKPSTTIIMVTHRLNTLDIFDKVIKINNGQISYIAKNQ